MKYRGIEIEKTIARTKSGRLVNAYRSYLGERRTCKKTLVEMKQDIDHYYLVANTCNVG